ncbi:hypothetical protein VFPFJ_00485 [Purpureocillium lilacinum]|uniref:Uncharacterized protein n=1 Tax=Purpureocillium lilacinum TaxID=33203 RepID=A0A179HV46_PURLI|nr:hypothetical protein VFPFJ_00485 [Purpureocillium lilacinum]OAQ94376.1 hypothetical protein VFPFJ_00485 [Purpureocillium lilacinum]
MVVAGVPEAIPNSLFLAVIEANDDTVFLEAIDAPKLLQVLPKMGCTGRISLDVARDHLSVVEHLGRQEMQISVAALVDEKSGVDGVCCLCPGHRTDG